MVSFLSCQLHIRKISAISGLKTPMLALLTGLTFCAQAQDVTPVAASASQTSEKPAQGVPTQPEAKPVSTPVETKPVVKTVKSSDGKNQVRFAKTASFDSDTVVKIARQLAKKPYVALNDPLPPGLAKISYDEYRDIRFKPDASIWRAEGLPYQMQLFHRGFYFQDLIEIALVEGNKATHLAYNSDYFTAGDVITQRLPTQDIGYSGLRIHYPLNTKEYFDELMVFQGASYFRALGKGSA